MVCSISNIKVNERGNIGENPGLAFFSEDLEYF